MKKLLSGMVPVCIDCKKIRDDSGYWKQIESYIEDPSEVKFNHALCLDCLKKFCHEFYDENAEHDIFISPLPYPIE